MSRISFNSPCDVAAAGAQHSADAQQRTARTRNARNSAQFAALYCGTMFTYGSAPQSELSVRSPRTRHMADSLARKRRAEKRQPRNLRGGADEHGGAHGERLRVTRDGGHRGGGGQSHDGNDPDGDASALPPIKARFAANIPPPSGRLDAVAARFGPGEEGARATAVRDAWQTDMLTLFRQVAANPKMDYGALVHQLKIDLLQIQRRIGALPPGGGIAALRTQVGTWPDSAGNSGHGELSARLGGIGATGARPMLPQRARNFNLLFGLLWKHADLTLTPTHCAHALGTHNTLRNSILGRADVRQAPQEEPAAPKQGNGTASGTDAPLISALTRGKPR
jgi:hypothetical protein